MSVYNLFLTGEQIRAGRALARIDQADLAEAAGVSLETIKRLERIRGPVDAVTRTLVAICDSFLELGVVFDHGKHGAVGVRLTLAPETRANDRLSARSTDSPLHRVIYHSKAQALDEGDVDAAAQDILNASVANNQLAGVTGALMVCDGRYLQALEGSRAEVLRIYGAIAADPRHRDVQTIQSKVVTSRQFADWSMRAATLPRDAEAIVEGLGMTEGFKPEQLTAVSAMGLLALIRDDETKVISTTLRQPRRPRRGAHG